MIRTGSGRNRKSPTGFKERAIRFFRTGASGIKSNHTFRTTSDLPNAPAASTTIRTISVRNRTKRYASVPIAAASCRLILPRTADGGFWRFRFPPGPASPARNRDTHGLTQQTKKNIIPCIFRIGLKMPISRHQGVKRLGVRPVFCRHYLMRAYPLDAPESF